MRPGAERTAATVDASCEIICRMRARNVIAFVLLMAGSGTALGGQVRCGSASELKTCRVASAGKIRLVVDLSQNRCNEGVTWGTQSSGVVWVSGGCTGVFEAEEAPAARPQVATVDCVSTGERTRCEAETKLGVALVRVTGTGRCVLDETWGFEETGVWVSGGCGGLFALGGFRLEEAAVPKSAHRVTCESIEKAENRCPFDSVRGVGLIRETGKDACVLNRTWGYDKTGIWVKGGCRAEFAVVR